MRDFYEFIEDKRHEDTINQIADKMVELGLNPNDFLHEWASSNLDENIFGRLFGGLRSAGSNMAQGVGTAARALGQQAVDSGKRFQQDAFGPDAMRKDAVTALVKLVNSLKKHPDGQSLAQKLNKLATDLNNVKMPGYDRTKMQAQASTSVPQQPQPQNMTMRNPNSVSPQMATG